MGYNRHQTTMKQKLLTLFLALAASVAPLFAETYSGTCGDNLTWTLDTESGTLTISGTGAMTDYTSSYDVPWYYSHSSTKTVIIEDGVKSIGQSAFYGCSSLTSITIPNSVTSIGNSAFYGCSSLTSITIPNSVTTIGVYAFGSCSSLTSITIPNSVTSIGDGAFNYCSSLTSINVDAANSAYCDIGGVLFSKDKTTLIQYPAGKTVTSYTIPNSVTSIGYAAFSVCSNLTSITIPNSVTSIGYEAFSACSSLTSITIPNSVTSIRYAAFCDCSSLTSVTIPNSVTGIGDYAFAGCSSLTSITIPNSVTTIGVYAFADCSSLTSITIPNSVTTIGDDAFRDCRSLTSITIPNSVTTIGDDAFAGCSSLTSIICEAINPPTLGKCTFCNADMSISLYVPACSMTDYNTEWADFIVKAIPGTGATIVWKNEDGTVLEIDEDVPCDIIPEYNGTEPTKPADAQHTYTFAGWDKELAAVTGDATYTATYDETINLPEGALPGEFAVSTTQKVRFSKGNLQCKATDYYNWTWQFASQQYEVMLEENHWNTSGVHILDLFGWGTTGYNNKYPTMFSTLTHEYGPDPATDIAGTRYEWGPYMSITNGGHAPGIWRTMTADEWNYILYTRPNADTRKGRAIVNGINGYVLLPDIWNCPAGFSINTDYSAFNDNVFSSEDWKVLERAGAVFIPCGGERYERALLNASISAFYWTSSYYGEVDSYRNASTIDFSKNGAVKYCKLERGRAVRLVQNSSTYTIALYTIATSATNGKVLGGGQYELNAIVSLTAIPDNGYSFIQWSDGNTDNPRDVIVTGDATYTAVFEKKELPSDITLQENETADYYTQFAQDYNGQRVNTATLNRQFTQGKWATLCLPFNVNKAMMMSLGLYNRVFAFRYAQQLDDETIQVFFVPAQSIEAGKGYIVNPNAKLAAKTSFVFPNVTINTDSDNGDITALTGYNDGTNRGNLFLVGTLRTGILQGTTTGNTYLGLKDNQLYYPNSTSGTLMRAYRAVFRSDVPVNASRVRIIADGEPVTELEVTVDEQGRMDNGQLQNNATPARKYLHNGLLFIERNGITYTAQGQRID